MRSQKGIASAHNNKGQAAIEYLMNYAWAIALIIIVGVAIYGLNIGGLRTSITSSGSQVRQSFENVAIAGYTCNANNFTLSLQNNGASRINSVAAGLTYTYTNGTEKTVASMICDRTSLFPGELSKCTVDLNSAGGANCGSSGRPYTASINISYTDADTSITYTPRRNLTGSIQG